MSYNYAPNSNSATPSGRRNSYNSVDSSILSSAQNYLSSVGSNDQDHLSSFGSLVSAASSGGNSKSSKEINDSKVSIDMVRVFGDSKSEKKGIRWNRFRHKCKRIVENKFAAGFTMLLTLYALLGDDLRLVLTQQPADFIFNWIIAFCIFAFTAECALSVIGKTNYLWSFFFWLDIISTASLLLDITDIADFFSTSSAHESNSARGGRAAKIGAKAGRVVRVIRLVRILKLYNSFTDAVAQKNKTHTNTFTGDEDDWGSEEDETDRENIGEESQVGKKLTEMTTRKVIFVILAMYLVLSVLRRDETEQYSFSASFGADHIWRHFRTYNRTRNDVEKRSYIHTMLHYIYYHNWFPTRSDDFCPIEPCTKHYTAHLFWIGFTTSEMSMAKTVQSWARLARLESANLESFERNYSKDLGLIPKEVHSTLTSGWESNCTQSDIFLIGLSLIGKEQTVLHPVECPQDLRPQEQMVFWPWRQSGAAGEEAKMVFYFDRRPFVQKDALFNLISTLYILILLILMTLVFASDANQLILHPIERMIKNVEAIRDDPLVAVKLADDEFRAEMVALAKHKRAKKERIKSVVSEGCSKSPQVPMETVVLQKTIVKLGCLLALGFGEAGVNIIGHTMQGGDSAVVNAMIPGTLVDCIIGVVRIRDFSTATEVLKGKILKFVNQIAEVVHGVVNEFVGALNRNSGESFLVIWRIQNKQQEDLPTASQLGAKMSHYSKMASLSIVAFAKIIGGLHRSANLASYRGHPGLQYRLGADCCVNLSFGLHEGWAIEGAVGSEFKIDASYLSPHVSVATCVERASQLYGVSLMVAQSVVKRCPKSIRKKCRLIDRVKITGSTDPMDVFCVDLDYTRATVVKCTDIGIRWNARNKFKVRQFLETEKLASQSDSFDVTLLFDRDPTLTEMREPFTVEFFELFSMGYQNYSQGEWKVAQRMLRCTKDVLGTTDGPSAAIMRHMGNYDFEAPSDWRGVRELVYDVATERFADKFVEQTGFIPTDSRMRSTNTFAI